MTAEQINVLEVRIELFKRGNFDFITTKGAAIHHKQNAALQILTDKETKEFSYGGAAGGAKSWTGAVWLTFMCLAYSDTRWFAGRQELKSLRGSTYTTFLKVFKKYGLIQGKDWHYDGKDNYFTIRNSRIDFVEMKYQPRDPMFERFGSFEFTGGWIEEAGEISAGAYDTIKTRTGRQNNDTYGLLGRVFSTLNPKKNWVHQYFWKPFKEGTLAKGIRFMQALVQDNPYIDAGYIETLQGIRDKVKKERLLFGNFDYDDDENALMTYDAIQDLFKNSHIQKGEKYLTIDVARFGKDESRIYEWAGWLITKIHRLKHKSVKEVSEYVKAICEKESIPMSRVIADEDGVGGGVVDILRCKGFVNGSSALENPKSKEKENYENLKTQCSYMAADMVNKALIGFAEHIGNNTDFVERFTEEAEQVKKRDADSDGKLKIVRKEDVKEILGRSPDDWDSFMMRQWFELTPKKVFADAKY